MTGAGRGQQAERSRAGFRTLALEPVRADPARRASGYFFFTLALGLYTYLALGHVRIPVLGFGQTLFRTRYALETAFNFGLCLLALDLAFLWLRKGRQSPAAFVGLILLAGGLSLYIQYTFIFHRVEEYFPKLILFYERYPGTRPTPWRVGWFVFQGWAPIVGTLGFLLLGPLRGRREEAGSSREAAKQAPSPEPFRNSRLDLALDKGRIRIDPRTICHATVEDHYSRIYYHEGGRLRQVFLKISLNELARRLHGANFVRIHRSHLVNLDRVSGLRTRGGRRWVSLEGLAGELPVSRRRLPLVRALLEVEDRAAEPA